MGGVVPDFVTHYHLPSRDPFQSLSDLDDDEALAVMGHLNQERRNGAHHRLFGKTYLAMRREAEHRLRCRFVGAGGHPTREVPHYFVLGESVWFRGLGRDMSEVRLPLKSLPAEVTSFTYGDSFSATGVGPEFGFGDPTDAPHRSSVYRLDKLDEIVASHGLPDDEPVDHYDGYERGSDDRFIEIQLWSDQPVRRFLDNEAC